MSTGNIVIYWGSGSIPCWKPLLVLEEKGLKYDSKVISFSKKEHKSDPEIQKLNPRQQVPTFKDGNVSVNESGAICDYLERQYADKGTQLIPKDPALAAQVFQRVHESQNLMRTVMEGVLYYFFITKPENQDKDVIATKKKEARTELDRWEGYLKQNSGGFLVGNEFTMADVFFFPFVAYCVRMKLDMSQFPAMDAYYKRLSERPSVKATTPPHWKDEPGKDYFTGI